MVEALQKNLTRDEWTLPKVGWEPEEDEDDEVSGDSNVTWNTPLQRTRNLRVFLSRAMSLEEALANDSLPVDDFQAFLEEVSQHFSSQLERDSSARIVIERYLDKILDPLPSGTISGRFKPWDPSTATKLEQAEEYLREHAVVPSSAEAYRKRFYSWRVSNHNFYGEGTKPWILDAGWKEE